MSPWTAVCGDEDLAFSLVPSKVLPTVHAGVLANQKKYRPILPSTIESRRLGSWYAGIVKEIIKVECGPHTDASTRNRWEDYFYHVLRSQGMAGLPASIQVTVKTHKVPGNVKVRAIHASCGFPCAPLGHWLASKIRPGLKQAPHILFSSDQFLAEVSKIDVGDDDLLFTADVHEFFTEGTPEVLADGVSTSVSPEYATVCRTAAEFVLQNQFVTSPLLDGIWECVEGTGIGQNFSSEVADANFTKQLEFVFLHPTLIRCCGIKYYGR